MILLPSQLLQACRLSQQTGPAPSWPSLRYVTVSGEECSSDLLPLFRATFPQAALLNLFGSTEVAGDVTYYEVCGPVKSNNMTIEHDSNQVNALSFTCQ